MAARRIAKSSINWSAMAERVPPNQKAQFAAFKIKSDVYMRAVMSNPETAPKIDWALCKNLIPIPGLVDTFQKQFDSFPDLALDSVNRPTFWPHNPEEQVGYVSKEQEATRAEHAKEH